MIQQPAWMGRALELRGCAALYRMGWTGSLRAEVATPAAAAIPRHSDFLPDLPTRPVPWHARAAVTGPHLPGVCGASTPRRWRCCLARGAPLIGEACVSFLDGSRSPYRCPSSGLRAATPPETSLRWQGMFLRSPMLSVGRSQIVPAPANGPPAVDHLEPSGPKDGFWSESAWIR